MDHNLQQRIENFEYMNLIGKSAIEEAYQMILYKFKDQKVEKELLAQISSHKNLEDLFEMYFTHHPEEAKQIVKTHEAKFTGLRKFLEPFAYINNQMLRLRYKAAKNQVKNS